MQEEISSSPRFVNRSSAAVAAFLVVVVAVAAYAFHERSVAKRLADQNNSVNSALDSTRAQMSALNARLDAMAAEKAAAEKPTAAPTYRQPMHAASSRHRIEDPRWKKMQGQLDDQAKKIDATRQDLASARTELSGSIATTHDELVLLQKKGERNYFEFDLDKSGQFTREGPVGVKLRKANTKHAYADLELLVDDMKVSQKHVNIFQPAVFYAGDSKAPVEIVINNITKNHIHGYVSEAKYKTGDLQAANSPAATAAPAAANSAQPEPNAKPSAGTRQRLEVPKN